MLFCVNCNLYQKSIIATLKLHNSILMSVTIKVIYPFWLGFFDQ